MHTWPPQLKILVTPVGVRENQRNALFNSPPHHQSVSVKALYCFFEIAQETDDWFYEDFDIPQPSADGSSNAPQNDWAGSLVRRLL